MLRATLFNSQHLNSFKFFCFTICLSALNNEAKKSEKTCMQRKCDGKAREREGKREREERNRIYPLSLVLIRIIL